MKVKGKLSVEVELDNNELANALKQYLLSEYFDSDDEVDLSEDLYTEDNFQVYIGKKEKLLASDSEVASIVDTINILKYGYKLEIKED